MSILRGYRPEMFSGTPDFFEIRDAAERLERDAHFLGDIICEYGLNEVFGVALLHRHFSLETSEILVRRYRDQKYSFLSPERISLERLAPYLWRVVDDEGTASFYPLEFCYYESRELNRTFIAHRIHYESRPEFFEHFGNVLLKMDMQHYVALSALHARDAFLRDDDETLLEMTDEQNRFISLQVVSREVIQQVGDTTKTLWCFSPTKTQIEGARCASHCYAHCYGHERDDVSDVGVSA